MGARCHIGPARSGTAHLRPGRPPLAAPSEVVASVRAGQRPLPGLSTNVHNSVDSSSMTSDVFHRVIHDWGSVRPDPRSSA